MSSDHLYRVGRADFDTLAASGAQRPDYQERARYDRPYRVLGAGTQARAAAAALTGDHDAHGSAHL